MTHRRKKAWSKKWWPNLSKTTAEAAWPSNKSLFVKTNFNVSFFFSPAVRRVAFWALQNVFLHSQLFPGGSWEAKYFFHVNNDLSLNLCSPARVTLIILTKGMCTTDSADRADARIVEYTGLAEGCVCLLWLCCRKWWCTLTFHIWSHWWQTGHTLCFLAFFSALKSAYSYRRCLSHRHAGHSYFISGMTDPTQCTLSCITLPTALKILLCIISYTDTRAGMHTSRTQNTHSLHKRTNTCWP